MVELAEKGLGGLDADFEQVDLLLDAVTFLLVLGKVLVEIGELVEGGHGCRLCAADSRCLQKSMHSARSAPVPKHAAPDGLLFFLEVKEDGLHNHLSVREQQSPFNPHRVIGKRTICDEPPGVRHGVVSRVWRQLTKLVASKPDCFADLAFL